jgi:RNA polymerase sigma-70 factor (ECF subfamily)
VAESADAIDSKSIVRKDVWVRVPLAAPHRQLGVSVTVEEVARRSETSPAGAPDAAEAVTAAADVTSGSQADEQAQRHARDRALVEAALAGDLDAFNHLVAEYQDYLFALAVRVVGDRDSAADAVQEAFFSCYRNLDRFRGDSFRAWLTRIALNAATDVLRQRRRRPAEPYPDWEDEAWQPPAGADASPERRALRRSAASALREALALITGDQRAAIVLYDVEGYDYAEIAQITGVSLGTVKSRIHRGRIALRELLGPHVELLRDE